MSYNTDTPDALLYKLTFVVFVKGHLRFLLHLASGIMLEFNNMHLARVTADIHTHEVKKAAFKIQLNALHILNTYRKPKLAILNQNSFQNPAGD